MITSTPILGIDVDLLWLSVCLLIAGETRKPRSRKFSNSPAGYRELDEWLSKYTSTKAMICLESTGRYGEGVAKYFYYLEHKVSVINPGFIVAHKTSLNKKNKTDPVDGFAVADYSRCHPDKLRLWQPLSAEHEALRDILGQIQLLIKTRTAFVNRGKCGLNDDGVAAATQEMIAFINKQIEDLTVRCDELFEQLPDLKELADIADSVPGVGPEIAKALVTHIRVEDFRNGRPLAVFLGCSTSEWESGKQKRAGKQHKAGDKHLRSLLRQGAASCLRSRFFRDFVQRLQKKGLSKGQIVGAIARKILLMVHALWRSRTYFDPAYRHPLAKPR